MRNRNHKMKNRIMAMGLTMCMTISPMAGYVPGEYVVFAEENVTITEAAEDTKYVEAADDTDITEATDNAKAIETSGGEEVAEPADSTQTGKAADVYDEDFVPSKEETTVEIGGELRMDEAELPGEASTESTSEDFRLATVCEGVAFLAIAKENVFPEGAKLSVEKTDDAVFSRALEEAVGAEGAYTHRQYDIKVTDDQDQTLQFEPDAVSVQVEGIDLSEGARVAVYDTEQAAAGEIEVRIDTERNAIEFTLADTSVYDIFTITSLREQMEENAGDPDGLPEEELEIPSGDETEETVEASPMEEPAGALHTEESVDTLITEEPVDALAIEELPDELAMLERASAAGEEENSEIDFSGDTYEEDEEEEVDPDEFYDDWDELQEAIEDAEEGAIFALDDDLDADEPLLIPAGQTITLDLNGCELSRDLRRPEEDGCVIIVEGNLTLIDQAGGGRITGGNNTGDGGGIYVAEGGSLTLRGAVIEDNSCEGKGGGVYAAGDFTLKSGEISSNDAEDEGGGVYFENTFAMKGGSLSANTPEDVYLDSPMSVSGNARISNAWLSLTDTAGFVVNGSLGDRALIRLNLNQTAVGEKNVPVTNGLKDRGKLDNFILNKKGDCDLVLDAAGEAVICKYAVITFLASNGTNATKQESVIPGSDYTLPECDFFTDPQGRPFQAWLLEDGTIKKPGEVIHVTESLSATAQWALTWSGLQDRIKAAGWNDTIKVPGSLTRQTAEDVLTIPADKKITLDLAGCTLDGAGIGDQPVIYVEGALILTDSIGGGRITGGSAGGIVVNGGSFSLQKGEISGNTAKELGGGVLVKSGSFTMDGTGASVSGNTAQNGGGIGVSGGSFVLNKGNVTGNTAAEGGGVAVTGGKLTLSGGRIGNNTAGNGGGVSVLSGAAFTIQSGTISGNTASANGGGLLLQGGAKASLSGGTIEKNSAKSQGGGLYLDGGDLTLRGTGITGNDASTGGGIAAYNSTFMLDSGNISFNTAASQGGGLYIRKGEASLNGGSVTGNIAGYGGGMFLGESTLVMPKNIITQNTAGVGGAGVAFSDMTLQLPALACVKNNRIGSGEADYWLQDGAVFDVTTQLDASYKVYVSAQMKQGESRIIATGAKLSRDNFISADTGYVSSRNAGGDIILGEPITVRFDAGDGSGTMADDIVARGGNYTLPQAKGLTAPDGLELQGWAIDKDDYWDHKTKAVGYNLSVEDELLTEGVLKLTACWGKGTLYVDENGTNHVAALVYPLTDYQSQGAVTLETGWYLADGAVFDQRVTIDGDVNIIIDNVHTTAMNKSILLPEGSKLSVWGEGGWETSSGKLVAAGGTNGNAAIGGTTKRMPGTFVLRSGEVEAAGSTNAAGIGGGNGTNGGSVVIHGGKLTAKGGANAAGIGGGMGGSQGGMVSIYGGTVYAYGGAKAAGIGGGSEGNGGQVAVIGATVSAQGGISGAGIGGGSGGNGGSVSVSVGATVTALAGKNPYENSASDKQPQAIGRGFMTGSTVLNGTLTLTDSCYVDAGESASTAVKYTTGREDACRQPYAKVNPTASLPTVFPINKKDVDLELASVFIYKASDLKKKASDPKSSLKEVNEADIQDEIAVKIVPNGSYHHYDGIEIRYSYHGENLELTDYQVSEGVDKDEKGNQYPYTLVTFKMPMGEVTVAPKIKTDTYQITVNVVDGQGTGYAAVENVPATEAAVGKEVILHCTSAGSGWFLDVQQRSNQPESEYTPHVSWFDSEKQETVVEKTAGVGVNDDTDDEHEDISNKEVLRSFTMPAGDVTVDLIFRKGVNYYDTDGVRKLAKYYHTVSEDDTEWNGGGVEDNFYYVGESMTLKNRVKLGCQVNLILGPGVTLTCEKGLQVSEKNGGKLYLHEEVKDGGSHLSCDASDEDNCAGIGGNDGETGGTVVICGGKVTAKGGYKAAGIGGGNHGALLEYKQYGGNVTAEGGKYGAGVGGGEGYDGSVEDGISDEVNIYGGELHATGGSYGAGIGGGQSMHQGKAVKIHNGMVYATGGRDAAGIGGGEEFSGSSRDVGGNGGEVYVYDGYVEAKGGGGEGGAGIGGGQDGKGKKFVMTGGEVHAEGGDDSAGIGGSNQDGGDVEISGGWVYAKGGTDAAGIGGGDDHAFGTITISGGYVEAEGGKNGAGIGTGCWGEGGTINLYGGEVHADGGTDAAGVGGGCGNWWYDDEGHVDTITLRCCDLYAYGDFCAVGPGRWWAGKYSLHWGGGDISVGSTKGSATEYVSKDQLKELKSHKYAEYLWSVKETRNTYTEQLWGEGQYFYGTWYSAKEYHRVNISNESANVHVRKPEKHNLVPYPGDTQPARMYCPDCGYFVQCEAIFHRDNDPDGEVFTESHQLNGKYVMPKYAWAVPEGNEFIGWRSGDTVVKPGETYLFTKDGENIYPVFEHRHGDQIFQAWEATDSLPASGSYYLLNDVDLGKKTWSVTSPVHLCLNGKTIRNAAISVASELTISDDAGEGSLAASSTVTVLSGSTFNLEDARSSARTEVQSGAEYNLINGEIRGVSGGYAVRVDGTLNLIGGQITGNTGGGVYASSGAMVRMGDIDTASIIYNQGTAGQRESAKKSYGFRFASITGNTRDGSVCNVYLEPGSSFEGVFDDDDSSQGSLFSNLHAKQLVLVNELPIRETRREAGSKGREEGCRLWNRSDDLRDFQYIYVFGSTMTFDLTGMETDFSVDPMEGYLDTENGKDQIVLTLPGCTALPNRQGVDYLKSWVIGSKTYQPGDSYTLKGNVTVTATHGFDWYDLQTWLDESSPGSVIKLPVDLDSYLNAKTQRTGFKVTKDVTIDLNGKKIICNYTLENIFTVDGAALTLKDSAGGGQITGSKKTVFDVVNGGTVHMEGGQIDHCTSAIASVQKGTFDVTGGTITANTLKKGRLIDIQDGIFQISGSPVIEGNIAGSGKDYQLEAGETNRIIRVTGPLSADARIGIYSDSTENVVITSGLSGNGTGENFFSNVNGKTISLNEKGEAVWMDAPAFRTYALLPSEENAVNVYLELPEINGVDYTDSYMEFRMKDSEKKTVTRALYDPEKRDAGGNGWYGFTCYADYPRVDGSITAVFHYGEGMTVEKTYSVRNLFFPDMFILSFDANGGSGEMASVSAKRSASYTLPECGFTAPGKVFAKWYVNSSSYAGTRQPGDVITVTSDTTIQARWESAVTIRFDANGGSGEMDSVDIAQSASYTLPECGFTAEKGMRFAGWQVNQDTKDIRQPGDVITVTDDLTLTAIWKHMHDGLTFSPWDKSNELPVSDYWSTLESTERNYYLTKDVVLYKDWKPYVDVNLCLNGHTITIAGGSGIFLQNRAVNIYDCDEEGGGCIRTEVSGWKCVTVSYGGTLTLYGGSFLSGGSDNVVISGGDFVMKGGVVQSTAGRAVNFTSGSFIMEGGTIKGGSIVQSSDTFELIGGTIDGSQVELSDGVFDMRGGAIEHATVNVWGDMIMSGGSISGAAKDYAVNVYDDGGVRMYGGEITGNTGGGVHVASKAEAVLSQCEVTGNTKDGKPCNIYLEKDAILSLRYYDRSDNPAKYGISTAVAPTKEKPVVITSGLKRNFTLRELFLPDDESYSVRVSQYGEPELELCVPPTVTFDANGGHGSMASAKANGGTWGDEYTLPECGFDAPSGMKFAGWQEERDTFVMQPGDVINISEDVTFKAIWEKVAISTPTISPTPSNPSVIGGQSSSGGSGSGGLRIVTNRPIDSLDGAQTSGDQIPVLFGKALTTVSEITSRQNGLDAITKARYGEEDDQAAGEIYVLDEEVPLEKDVPLDEDQLKKYLLWTNVQTQHDMYLLPNATRLYRGTRLDYVSEVIRGNVLGDSDEYTIDIFTALNDNAYQHPVIPIGSTGSLDFATGIFSVPELADFELYLHEVSGEWLIEKFDEGFLRRLDADQDEINAYTQADSEAEEENQAESKAQMENETQTENETPAQGITPPENQAQPEDKTQETALPQGEIVEDLTADGEMDGRKKYWVGITPENASDDAQTLVYLLVNEETDEIDAFRTSRRMIADGDEDVDVSLYLYRDSKSDRMGEEKYNVMFFDTPEGEKSLVKVITDVLEERELEIPKTLRIVLRGFEIDGVDDTDYPFYSLTDHFFAMNDGTDGEVSMFDGFYEAEINGGTFESTYTRIESIPKRDSDSVQDQVQDGSSKDDTDQESDGIPDDGMDASLKVTVKKDQSIWPEWTSKETSSDIGGGDYILVDGEWLSYEEAKTTAGEPDS